MKKKFKYTYYSPSAEDTLRVGEIIGKKAQAGDVILLSGDLGTGKTWLTKGIAKGLEVPPEYPVTSPTFTFVHEYPGRLFLYHLDLYRLEEDVDWSVLGLEEYLFNEGVTVIEWAERLPVFFHPSYFLKIFISFANAGRKIEFVTNVEHFKTIVYHLRPVYKQR
ncbi:MAG: tRNA (adenosine(37)-N6)-threonylcarbamoyltransferase complex ATPase subunit type 1 TsaE [Candidatus Desulfofervidaceae bacterium]|nr:tRNA (adenosine(37)-N6)-threonylcarbamoyltransferase complex ATPase subunit type 1 TsaE [Candidatus Desulfofervidaceae bacterium]